jgi:hypothetical protein
LGLLPKILDLAPKQGSVASPAQVAGAGAATASAIAVSNPGMMIFTEKIPSEANPAPWDLAGYSPAAPAPCAALTLICPKPSPAAPLPAASLRLMAEISSAPNGRNPGIYCALPQYSLTFSTKSLTAARNCGKNIS